MDGIILTPLKKMHNPNGDVLHAMKKSCNGFSGFGEAYFSSVNKGIIKGWKKHSKMTLNIIVPFGQIQFVIFNENSNEFFNVYLSKQNYQRLTVKPGLWMAFRGIEKENTLLNLASIEHNPNEAVSADISSICYDW